jgi:hypothetical protein
MGVITVVMVLSSDGFSRYCRCQPCDRHIKLSQGCIGSFGAVTDSEALPAWPTANVDAACAWYLEAWRQAVQPVAGRHVHVQ